MIVMAFVFSFLSLLLSFFVWVFLVRQKRGRKMRAIAIFCVVVVHLQLPCCRERGRERVRVCVCGSMLLKSLSPSFSRTRNKRPFVIHLFWSHIYSFQISSSLNCAFVTEIAISENIYRYDYQTRGLCVCAYAYTLVCPQSISIQCGLLFRLNFIRSLNHKYTIQNTFNEFNRELGIGIGKSCSYAKMLKADRMRKWITWTCFCRENITISEVYDIILFVPVFVDILFESVRNLHSIDQTTIYWCGRKRFSTFFSLKIVWILKKGWYSLK